MHIRRVLSALLIAAGSLSAAYAQSLPADPTTLYAAGVSYNPNGTPGVAGSALAVHAIPADGTYVGAAIDVLPTSGKPFTVTTSIGPLVAKKLFTIGSVPIWAATGVTVAYAGPATGWGWNGGVTAPIRVNGSKWFIMPTVRFAGNSATGSVGAVQPIATVMVGYGQ